MKEKRGEDSSQLDASVEKARLVGEIDSLMQQIKGGDLERDALDILASQVRSSITELRRFGDMRSQANQYEQELSALLNRLG